MHETLIKLTQEARTKLLSALATPEVKELVDKTKDASDSGTFVGLAISTEDMDRQGDIVRQAGMDSSDYMLNPVVLNSHDYHGISNIVGVTTKLYTGTVNGVPATLADGKFAPTPEGQMARALWDGGFLSAASIGFIPTEFDKGNNAVITKWQLLEYSFVPVPANGKATRLRTFSDLGLDEEVLISKGFVIKAKDEAPELGSTCQLEDGSNGVWATDPNGEDGALICAPIEDKEKSEDEPEKTEVGEYEADAPAADEPVEPAAPEEKGAIADELAREETVEQKWKNLDAFFDLVYAFVDVYMDPNTPVDNFQTLVNELSGLMSAGITIEDDADAKGIKALVLEARKSGSTEALHALYTKAGRTISAASADKIQKCIGLLEEVSGTHIAGVIAALGELGSSNGGADESQEETAVDESKSEDAAPADLKELNDFMLGRVILRAIDNALTPALEEYNRRGKEKGN